MKDQQLEQRRRRWAPTEIIAAITLFGVIVAMGVLMTAHPF
jgi:hypothetical protein